MPTPLTIIIPTFDRQALTDRALASACSEAPADAEILVVDDASPAPFAARDADRRVRVIRHEENRGAAAARNTGLRAAQGEWIAFLDSDDVWPAGSFAGRWRAAREGDASELTVWAGGFRRVGGRRRERLPRASGRVVDFASGCWFCPGSTALFRREPILDAVGLQDETLRRLEDYDWFLRFALAGGRLEVHPEIVAEIARGRKPPPAQINAAAALLRAKFTPLLDAPARRALGAYLDLERAAAHLDRGALLAGAGALAASWAAAPRARLALRDFWAS